MAVDPDASAAPVLHLTIRTRLDKLRQECEELYGDFVSDRVGNGPQLVREFYSNVQLWKERSLHHTLETLDRVQPAESHIEAMEHHERAARELFALTRTVFQRTRHELLLLVGAFGDDLAALVHRFTIAKLDEQRVVHDEIIRGLEHDKGRLTAANQELQHANSALHSRLEVLESSPTTGGDAILCNKLRAKLTQTTLMHRNLVAEVEAASEERLQNRRELEKAKARLVDAQKALALTRAMHNKETRQLAALIQLNQAQVAQVLEASRDAAASAAAQHLNQQQPLERFDPLSGCMIVHLAPISTPQKPVGSSSSNSPRRKSSPVVTVAPAPKQRPTQTSEPRRRVERPSSANPARRTKPAIISSRKHHASSTNLFHSSPTQS